MTICLRLIHKEKMNGTYKGDAIFERCSTHPSAFSSKHCQTKTIALKHR